MRLTAYKELLEMPAVISALSLTTIASDIPAMCVEVDSAAVPTVCSAVLKGSATSSQGIHGNISVMATVKFTFLL